MRDRSLVVLGGLQIASCGVGFTSIVVGWRGCAAFWARVVDVGDGVHALLLIKIGRAHV